MDVTADLEDLAERDRAHAEQGSFHRGGRRTGIGDIFRQVCAAVDSSQQGCWFFIAHKVVDCEQCAVSRRAFHRVVAIIDFSHSDRDRHRNHDWFGLKSPGDPRRAAELKEASVAATPAVGPQSSWTDLVTVNLTARLIELIESWQACLGIAAYLADPAQKPSADRNAMPGSVCIAFLSALAAAIAMGLCAFFWIATAWPEGGTAVSFAAVTCALFASLDDPTPAQRNITMFLALCIPIVVVYQFFILPAIGGFELLCVVLAFALIPAGLLIAIPAYASIGSAFALAFCVELSLQTSYT